MVLTQIIKGVLFLCCSFNFSVLGKTSPASTSAIVSLIERGILQNLPTKLDLVYFGNAIKLADEVLRSLPKIASVAIKDGTKNQPWTYQLNISTVLLFDSRERFRDVIKPLKWLSNRWMRYKHIVYAPNLIQNDVTDKLKDGFPIDKVAFLMNETQNSIDLVSAFMFTAQKCHQNQLLPINKFDYRTNEWESSNFFPQKYGNLHGCILNLMETYNGIDIEVYPIFAARNNFQIKIYRSRNWNEKTLPKQPYYLTDFVTGNSEHHYPEKLTATPFAHSSVVAYAPDGEPYTQFEKMFKMFDTEVWIAIACTLGFLAASIGVINRLHVKFRNFVFGRGVKTPFWNLLDIFLNGAQNKMPMNNFARFVLILVIIWSLIIRTCYQSLLFLYMQADMREPHISSLYEVKSTSQIYYLMNHTNENGKKFDVKWDSYSNALDEASEPSNKVIAVSNINDAQSKLTYRHGRSSLHQLEEKIVSWKLSVMFPNFSPFFEEFNAQIGRMVDSGLFYDNVKSFNYRKPLIKDVVEDIGPQVLTMDNLEVAFIVCLIPMSFALLVFLVEISILAFRTLIPEIGVYYALRRFLNLAVHNV